MSDSIHKGNELRNVSETWAANEQNAGGQPGREDDEVPAASELDRMVRQESAEYDSTNSEDRLQGGERATVNDDEGR